MTDTHDTNLPDKPVELEEDKKQQRFLNRQQQKLPLR